MNKKEIPEEFKVDHLFELAVWGNLDRFKDIELILLKGHLYLETTMSIVLERFEVEEIDNKSFYKKMKELEKLKFSDRKDWKIILSSLHYINSLRNKLAHDFRYKSAAEDLSEWADKIRDNLEGTKYSNYTKRTKIVHAFSTLSNHILALSYHINKNKKAVS